jgi:hypothetical protein
VVVPVESAPANGGPSPAAPEAPAEAPAAPAAEGANDAA